MTKPTPCPCGSGRPYPTCCGPFLEGTALPPTAEALMRSRYSAYARGQMDYLHQTWHPDTRHANPADATPVKWIGLEILCVSRGGPDAVKGRVEFVARYKIGGRAMRLHEISEFIKTDGRWYYVAGEVGQRDSSVASRPGRG